MPVFMKPGSPFLFDQETGDIVGVKDSDGGEQFFPTSAEFAAQAAAIAAVEENAAFVKRNAAGYVTGLETADGVDLLASAPVGIEVFGAVDDGVTDCSSFINTALSSGKAIELSGSYLFTNITIPASAKIVGSGRLIGKVSNGSAPTTLSLDAAATSADRLAVLQSYNRNTVTYTGFADFFGRVSISNAVIVGSGNRISSRGIVELYNCSLHNIDVYAAGGGYVTAPSVISSDSPGYAFRAEYGGNISIANAVIYKSGSDSLYVFYGGEIYADHMQTLKSGRMGIHVNGGGSVYANLASITYPASNCISVEYGGSVNFAGGTASYSVASSGIACESNGAVYAQGATVSNNALWPLTTSYGGFIQAKNATITNNGRAVRTLTGGVIQVLGATVTGNNGGGVQMQANALGFIFSEPAGTASSGKQTLTASQYLPPYGVMAQGMGMIYDGESGADYPNDSVGVSLSRVYRPKANGLMDGVSLTASTPWVIVDTSAGAVVIEDIQLASGFSTEELYIQPSGENSLTIQSGAGNVRVSPKKTATGGINNVLKVVKTGFIDRWTCVL